MPKGSGQGPATWITSIEQHHFRRTCDRRQRDARDSETYPFRHTHTKPLPFVAQTKKKKKKKKKKLCMTEARVV